MFKASSGAARRARPAKTKTARIPPRRSAVAPKNSDQRAAAQCRRLPLPA